MKKNITVLILLFCIAIHAQTKNKVEKSDISKASAVYRVESEDTKMKKAIRQAKASFNEFEIAIKSDNPNFKNFLLKKGFETPNGDEYLWVRNILINKANNNYVGIVANEPLYTKAVQNGDFIEINKDDVADWMYLDNDVVKGGYTLKLLRSQMSKKEQQQFDAESNLKFK
ncbi:DUF2314 domain-containing protein [Flavobacterium sp. CGRL1]